MKARKGGIGTRTACQGKYIGDSVDVHGGLGLCNRHLSSRASSCSPLAGGDSLRPEDFLS